MNLSYLYLLAPLHTGGTTQEGNLLGIARESHTTLPYIPSSTIRGRLRASVIDRETKFRFFGNEIEEGVQLTQGSIWIGDGSILWVPVPSLSHGVVWVSCPMLLQRWCRSKGGGDVPADYSTNLGNSKPIYLKDAILKASDLKKWDKWKEFVPAAIDTQNINQVLVLPDRFYATVVQMGLWRQVKVKLDSNKTVEGGFRYEEAIPPDTLMYYPWGTTTQANGSSSALKQEFESFLANLEIIQIGGQESLGRGFVSHWYA